MPDSDLPIALKESDLIGKPKEENKAEEVNINDSLVKMIRSAAPKQDWKLTDDTVDAICENLAKGVPIEACAACVYVTPHTLNRWLQKGKEEVCNLTEEQLDSSDNILSLLSPYGKLFLRQAQAKGHLMVTIMDAIYDKMFEQHNEWLLTYLAERLDPETFNLKYKMEKMKVEAGAIAPNTQNFVNITFVNGMESRSPEEIDFLKNSLDNLSRKYGEKHMINVTDGRGEEEEDQSSS